MGISIIPCCRKCCIQGCRGIRAIEGIGLGNQGLNGRGQRDGRIGSGVEILLDINVVEPELEAITAVVDSTELEDEGGTCIVCREVAGNVPVALCIEGNLNVCPSVSVVDMVACIAPTCYVSTVRSCIEIERQVIDRSTPRTESAGGEVEGETIVGTVLKT